MLHRVVCLLCRRRRAKSTREWLRLNRARLCAYIHLPAPNEANRALNLHEGLRKENPTESFSVSKNDSRHWKSFGT